MHTLLRSYVTSAQLPARAPLWNPTFQNSRSATEIMGMCTLFILVGLCPHAASTLGRGLKFQIFALPHPCIVTAILLESAKVFILTNVLFMQIEYISGTTETEQNTNKQTVSILELACTAAVFCCLLAK